MAKHRAAFAADPKFLARIGQAQQNATAAIGCTTAASVKRQPSAASKRLEAVAARNKDGRLDFVIYDPHRGAISFVFPGAVLLGHNVMLRTHNAKAKGLKDTWNERVRAVCLENRDAIKQWQDEVTFPLIAEEVYVTGESSMLDTEAVCASCKPVIDALVKFGSVIPDDSRKYLSQPIAYTERGHSPTLVISFKPSPRPWGFIDDETVSIARDAISIVAEASKAVR